MYFRKVIEIPKSESQVFLNTQSMKTYHDYFGSYKSSMTSAQQFELNHHLFLLIESIDARCQLQFTHSRPTSSPLHVTLPSCE